MQKQNKSAIKKMDLDEIQKSITTHNGIDVSGLAFIKYLNYYTSEGIKFNIAEINGTGSAYYVGDTVFISNVNLNKDVEFEIIKLFFERRWKDYWANNEDLYNTNKKTFIDLELEFLDKFPDNVKKEYSSKYYALYNYFVDSKLEIEKMNLQTHSGNIKNKPKRKIGYTYKTIGIALGVMGIKYKYKDQDRAKAFLKKYTINNDFKELLKEIHDVESLKKIGCEPDSIDSGPDTKHYQSLIDARKIISSKYYPDIDDIIDDFKKRFFVRWNRYPS